MDKTIEIIIVAMVVLITATIVLFLVQDQTSSYDDFLGGQQSDAQCDLWKAQYKNSDCKDDSLKSKINNDSNSCGELPEC